MANHPLDKNQPTKIAELRQKAQLTQFELAEQVGVTETTIANWENGRTDWIERIVLLIDALDCSFQDLLKTPLRELREEAKFSRRALARAIDVKENTVATWENKGSQTERFENIARLCLVLGCSSPEELIPLPEKKVESAPAKISDLSGEALLKEFEQVQARKDKKRPEGKPVIS